MTSKWPTKTEINALPKDGGPHFNRLIFEDRLYLKSHAHQAIRWYPWGQSAFELARLTNKPLFLSIGYSSCHWCHVMSDKTFDHPAVAKKLNDHFIAIKIDRDQYPDIDQIYMAATQLLTQQAGWPNSVFCLPTGQPFYSGTYFPPDDHDHGIGFLTLLDQLAGSWEHNYDQIQQQAQELERVIIQMNRLEKDPYQSMKMSDYFNQCCESLVKAYDSTHGGFGGSPKFPSYAALRLLLNAKPDSDMVVNSLRSMALSGLYDQVEGGFHRYSTDEAWHLPHFEKMLMDNAQMIELYSLGYAQSGEALFKRVVEETISFLLSAWALPDGGFLSTIDADSDGEEGHYYVMSMDEVQSVAHPDDFDAWVSYFQLLKDGNVRDEMTGKATGFNVFHPITDHPPFDWDDFRSRALAFRQGHRQSPNKDDAFVISSNAWLAQSLFIAADVFSNPSWREVANDTLSVVMTAIRAKASSVYLDDIVYALSAQLRSENDLGEAQFLWGMLLDQFYDHGEGGLWFSQDEHRTPMSRIKDIHDQSMPSPNGVFIDGALELYQLTNGVEYIEKAMDVILSFLSSVSQSMNSTGHTGWGVSILQMQTKNSYFDVQFATCRRESEDVILIQIDVVVVDYYILQPSDFLIHHVAYFEWLHCHLDPIKSIRMPWSEGVVSCATGIVRFNGRCRLPVIPDRVSLAIPVCSNSACFDPVVIDIPVV